MVSKTLVITRSKSCVDSVDSRTLPRLSENLVKDRQVQSVDLVVVIANLFGKTNIFSFEKLYELVCDRNIQLTERSESGSKALGNNLVGKTVTSQLSNVLSHITHALKRRRDTQSRNDNTKVASDGLLTSQNVDREFIQLDSSRIDLVVIGDHLLSERHIRLVESASRIFDGHRNEGRDLDEPVLHLSQFLLEYFAHSSSPFDTGMTKPARL